MLFPSSQPALPFTNHTASFTGVIDYIWFTSVDFEVLEILGGYFFDHPQPQHNSDSGNVWSVKGSGTIGFPNPIFPSDHIPVVAVLKCL